jgi:hypothetical protein
MRQAARDARATESGGARVTESGGARVTESGGARVIKDDARGWSERRGRRGREGEIG